MPNSKIKKNLSLDKDLVERFEYLYPHLIHIFLTRSLKKALQDKKYFEDVFFSEMVEVL